MDESRWLRLGRIDWYTVWSTAPLALLVVVAVQFAQASFTLGRQGGFAVVAVVYALGALAPVVIAQLRSPQPWVNLARGELRMGRRVLRFEQIERAVLTVMVTRRTRVLVLHFGAEKGGMARAVLRDRSGNPIEAHDAALLVAVLDRSNVRMPEAKEDPSGRFARYNFPGHVTKDEAIALVRNPPDKDDPLPIPT